MEHTVLDKSLPSSDRYRVFADGQEVTVINDVEYDYAYIYTNDLVTALDITTNNGSSSAVDLKVSGRTTLFDSLHNQ